MSRRKSGSGVGFGSRRMTLEQLEGRSLLAGVVSAYVSGGSLFINGDNTDNALIVQDAGNGNYTVTGFDFGAVPGLTAQGFKAGPTTIKGGIAQDDGSFLFTGVTNDIVIDLKKGNDGLAMGNSIADISTLAEECFGFGGGMGSGSSSQTSNIVAQQVDPESQFTVPGNLFVYGRDGNDYAVISANVGHTDEAGNKIGGVAVVDMGNGNDGLAFGNPVSSGAPAITEESAPEVTAQLNEVFSGNAHVLNSLYINMGAGNDNNCVDGTTVDNLLSVVMGAGSDEFHGDQIAAGDAELIGAAGDDFLTLTFFALDRTLLVDSGAGNDDVVVANFSMGHGEGPASQSGAGFATIVTGAGNDGLIVEDFECDNLVVDTGAGNDGAENRDEFRSIKAQQVLSGPVFVGFGDITYALTVVTGAGNDFAEVESINAHDVVVDTGAGNDGSQFSPIAVYNLAVVGNLTVATGAGNDFAYLHSGNSQQSTIGGSVVVDTGAGNDSAEVIDQTIGLDLVVALGAGNNNADIGTSGAAGEVESTLSIGRNLVVTAAGGKDNVDIGAVNVLNDLFAALGAGDDSLFVNGATIGNNATVDAGAGKDSVTIESTQITGTASIYMGAGNDTLTISNSNGNKLLARGGAGKDTFNNDLGITSNGTTASTDVKEFEFFNDISGT